MKRTITSTAMAFISEYGVKASDLPTLEDASQLIFYTSIDGHFSKDWVKVGEATITVVLDSVESAVAGQVAMLQKKLDTHRVESQMKENAIQDEISKLSALTNDM